MCIEIHWNQRCKPSAHPHYIAATHRCKIILEINVISRHESKAVKYTHKYGTYQLSNFNATSANTNCPKMPGLGKVFGMLSLIWLNGQSVAVILEKTAALKAMKGVILGKQGKQEVANYFLFYISTNRTATTLGFIQSRFTFMSISMLTDWANIYGRL